MKKYLYQLTIILIIFSFFPVLTVAQFGEESGFCNPSSCVVRAGDSDCIPGSNTCGTCPDGSANVCDNHDTAYSGFGACGFFSDCWELVTVCRGKCAGCPDPLEGVDCAGSWGSWGSLNRTGIVGDRIR